MHRLPNAAAVCSRRGRWRTDDEGKKKLLWRRERGSGKKSRREKGGNAGLHYQVVPICLPSKPTFFKSNIHHRQGGLVVVALVLVCAILPASAWDVIIIIMYSIHGRCFHSTTEILFNEFLTGLYCLMPWLMLKPLPLALLFAKYSARKNETVLVPPTPPTKRKLWLKWWKSGFVLFTGPNKWT